MILTDLPSISKSRVHTCVANSVYNVQKYVNIKTLNYYMVGSGVRRNYS